MSYLQNDEVREQLDPNSVTLNKLLAENCNLIQTISEYQRMGRPNDAVRYQELLHRNLMWLSKELDPTHIPDLQLEENLPPMNHQPPPSHIPQPVSVGPPSSVPPPSSSSGGTSIASPSRQPNSMPPSSQSQQNGHLSPYSHGPSPHMRNGFPTPQYMQHQHPTPPASQEQQPLPPQMHPQQMPGGYGMPNGYPPYGMPPSGPYMNGLPPPGQMPPR